MALVSDNQIINVLRSYNPWWQSPNLVKVLSKGYKRLAFNQTLKIIEHPSIRRFAVLSGPRRVGKTTVLYQLIDHLLEQGVHSQNVLYVSFDNPFLKFSSVEHVLELYTQLQPITGTMYLFLDEIQYTQDWELWLKVIYDSQKDIKLVATGSASPLIEKGASDSGTGRWKVLKVPTLSFYEYVHLLNLETPNIKKDLNIDSLYSMSGNELSNLCYQFKSLIPHFNRYLKIGGFPELALSSDDLYAQRMLREDVVDKVIKRDVLSLFNIRSPILMEKLFLYLCLNCSQLFSANTVAKELENTSVATIDSYISALEKSNLIYVVSPTNVGSKSALKGKPKIYISDAAIRNTVLMIDDLQADEKELGLTVETAVYKHLYSHFQDTGANLGYFREDKGQQKEVDAVVRFPKDEFLIEVKYRNDSKLTTKDAIVTLCDEDNRQISKAFVLTKNLDDCGAIDKRTNIKIQKIPTLVFLYVLGLMENFS